jgi:hypothetical protein
MRFYEYRPDANHFAGICVASGQDIHIANVHYDDSLLARDWSPIAFDAFDDNPEQVGDFPSLSNFNIVPVLSDRAWNCLRPVIGDACEALPVICPFNGPYFLIHVFETIDCLVEDCSEVDRSEVDQRIDRVFKYCLDLHKLQGKHIFKLPLKSGRELLVDDVFRAAVEDNRLKGLVFRDLRCCPGPLS